MRALAWPVAVVLLSVCACGSAAGPVRGPASSPAPTAMSGPASPASPAGSASASASPTGAAASCGGPAVPSRLVTVRTGDGVRLAGFEAGAGSRGVVLVPEAGSAGSCGWWPYAAYLARRGFHVLAFDHRCQGTSACPASGSAGSPASGPAGSPASGSAGSLASGSAGGPGQGLLTDIAAAVRALRAAGAGRVALLGASQGGSEALIAAARPARGPGPGAELAGLAGVAALSADELDQPLAAPPAPRTAVAAAAAVRVPVLLAVAPDDPYVSLAGTRALFAALATPAAAKRLLVEPAGAGHGWVMVDAAQGAPEPPLAVRLAAFLQTVTA